MKNKNLPVLTIALGIVLLLAACQQQPAAEPPTNQSQLANPASVYCSAAGYKEENRTDTSGGQYGVCVFPDGTECDSWAFARGECGQDKSFCVQKGGTLEIRDSVATCVFSNGSTCPELDFAQGQCAPAQ